MIEVRNIETILKRLINSPIYNGNMVPDTQSMYEETDQACTFEWIDERTKPTWAEITAEFYVYCAESDCPLCPDCCKWNDTTKEFEPDLNTWLETIVKPERKRIMDEYEWRYNRLEREINLSLPITLTREHIDNYMHQVHMFPDGLTEITDTLTWPTPPAE